MKRRKIDLSLERMFMERRIQSGLSQIFIAGQLGFSSAQQISNWERGLAQIPDKHFRKLSQLLGITLRDMVDHRVNEYRRRLLRTVRLS